LGGPRHISAPSITFTGAGVSSAPEGCREGVLAQFEKCPFQVEGE
jgi:hypothetical protein